jgi:Ala-tRNA(Pro) deacylase
VRGHRRQSGLSDGGAAVHPPAGSGAITSPDAEQLGLATESELVGLFKDCEIGAIPPIGPAYGIETVVDDSLLQENDVYFEAGDHEELIHVSGKQFRDLVAGARYGRFSHHV